jgi:beta-glucosidase
MTAFNRIGYTWTGASWPLITGILRNEWDFDGFIITDNANSGVFMDGYQMISAGADGKLTYWKSSARFDFDENNVAHYHYSRQAAHHILYTVANSKAMDGAMHGSVYKEGLQTIDLIIIAINVVCAILILLLCLFTFKRFRKRGKAKGVEGSVPKPIRTVV